MRRNLSEWAHLAPRIDPAQLRMSSRARSVPEYLRMRFDEKTRGFNAFTFAIMTILSSGISMYALAKLISGKVREASPAVLVLAVLFAVKFAVSG